MKTYKKLLSISAIIGISLTLANCSGDKESKPIADVTNISVSAGSEPSKASENSSEAPEIIKTDNGSIIKKTLTFDNGREANCVVYETSTAASAQMSCDWADEYIVEGGEDDEPVG